MAAIGDRMEQVGLRLHPDKTKIVDCKDQRRRLDYGLTAFTFLGFTFRTRTARGKSGALFASFQPAISNDARNKISEQIRRWPCSMVGVRMFRRRLQVRLAHFYLRNLNDACGQRLGEYVGAGLASVRDVVPGFLRRLGHGPRDTTRKAGVCVAAILGGVRLAPAR